MISVIMTMNEYFQGIDQNMQFFSIKICFVIVVKVILKLIEQVVLILIIIISKRSSNCF